MCGIIGFNSNDRDLGLKMTGKILHRGPDDEGVFCDENITLGNRRLAIMDLSSAGHMPMTSSDESLAITYNGEIYNYKELKSDLQSRNYSFKSNSDTEVMLYGYKEYGLKIFEKLRGMWSVAIYDKKEGKLILSRDYFGVKPLFYYFDGRELAFGSEIKIIKEFLNSKNKKLSFSSEGLEQYFVLGYTVQPNTVYKNIKKVRPGEVLIFELGKNELNSSFIDWSGERTNIDENNVLEQFESIMKDSVQAHLISDAPVGVFLSGGADSTLIALMMKKLGANLNAFTVRIEGKKDADYAKKIADFAGLKHHEIKFSQKEFEEQYEKCWEYLDEPITDNSLFPSLAVVRAASEKVKVVLTGEGGDELFLGYDRYQLLKGLNDINGSDSLWHILGKIKYPSSELSLKYLRPLMRRLRLGYSSKIKKDLLATYLESAAIDPDLMRREGVLGMMAEGYYKVPQLGSGQADISWPDRNFYLPNDLLYKTDFATMVYSVEGRVPFLDKEVFKFSNSLPMSWKLKDGVGKRIIKEYLAKNLPAELIFRKKEGFNVSFNIYKSEKYKKDTREAVAYCRDVFKDLDLNGGVFEKLSRDSSFLDLFESKFRHFLFAALSLYKTTSRTINS